MKPFDLSKATTYNGNGMTIYTSNYRGNASNAYYQNIVSVHDIDTLLEAVKRDHVFSAFKDNHRGEDDFLYCDTIVLDLDNTHSEDPDAWKTLGDISDTFEDVQVYYVQSRNYMKEKTYVTKDKTVTHYAPREKWHFYLPLAKKIETVEECNALFDKILSLYPYFDGGSAEPAHFFFGVQNPQGGEITGSICIDEYINQIGEDRIREMARENLESLRQGLERGDIEANESVKKTIKAVERVAGMTLSPGQAQGIKTSYTQEAVPGGLEWLVTVEQQKSERWLIKWADDNFVDLGKRYEINTITHPQTIVYCITCPWEDQHSMNGAENETVIMIGIEGRLQFLCRHSHGDLYNWTMYRHEMERRAQNKKDKQREELKQRKAQQAVQEGLNNSFAFWYAGNELSDKQAEWLENEWKLSDYDDLTAFYTAHKYLEEDGKTPTENGQKAIEEYAKKLQAGQEPGDIIAENPAAADDNNTAGEPTDQEPENKDVLDTFLDQISGEKYKPYETELPFFDNLLGGGVIRQSLLLLLAAPAAGKTTLAQQIAEAMAQHKKPVIYLNLEMSREQMLAKAISGRLSKKGKKTTALEVLQGYKWTPEQQQAITQEVENYRKEIFPYLQYNPGKIGSNLDTIKEYLWKVGREAQEAGKEAPVIILDYLHLLTSDNNLDVQGLIKESVVTLKQYAIDFDTFVIGIVAINRDSMKGGKITMTSGRDSSNIEYTGDYQLSLNYYEIDRGNVSPQDEEAVSKLKQQEWRQMIIRVIKHRLGMDGKSTRVYFHTAGNTFYGERDWMPADTMRTPFDDIPKAGRRL